MMMMEATSDPSDDQTNQGPVVFSLDAASVYQSHSYVQLFPCTYHLFTNSLPRSMAARSADVYWRWWSSPIHRSTKLMFDHNPDWIHLVALVLAGATVLTLIRFILTKVITENIFVKTKLIEPSSQNRFSESVWNCVFYSTTFTLAAIIVSSNEFISNPERLWTNYSLSQTVSSQIGLLYLLEISYYIHSMFAVLFINDWKKDSAVLFVHHLVALLLLSISFMTRTHRVGVLVVFLHDVCDVIMDGCKCIIKLKVKNPWLLKLLDMVRFCGFAMFIALWFGFRIYLYPLVVMYTSVRFLNDNWQLDIYPYLATLYTLLWFIFAMNLYWATLIFKVIINTIKGGYKEIDDIREVDNQTNSPNQSKNKAD